jgi:predicted RNA-binding protein with PUA domain
MNTVAIDPKDQINQYSLTSFLKDLKKVEKEKVVSKEEHIKENTLQSILALNEKDKTIGSINNSNATHERHYKRQEILRNT